MPFKEAESITKLASNEMWGMVLNVQLVFRRNTPWTA
jgi:hypothetical protein